MIPGPGSELAPLERWSSADLLGVLASLEAPAVREVSARSEAGAAYLEVQREHVRAELERRGVRRVRS